MEIGAKNLRNKQPFHKTRPWTNITESNCTFTYGAVDTPYQNGCLTPSPPPDVKSVAPPNIKISTTIFLKTSKGGSGSNDIECWLEVLEIQVEPHLGQISTNKFS